MSKQVASELTLSVIGMSCAGCSAKIERTLNGTVGVERAVVNFANRTAKVRLHSDGCGVQEVLATIRRLGFDATVQDSLAADMQQQRDRDTQELATLRRAFFVALVFTVPVFVLDMGGFAEEQEIRYLLFALAGVVQLGPGWRFYRTGVPALLRGTPDMNSLVFLGTTAAFVFSTVVTFAPQWIPESGRHVYFEASAVIITLVLLGRFLELKARGRAGEAIEQLLALQPQTARRLAVDGSDNTVPLADIRVGDRIRIIAGERIPVDSTVVSGSSYVDESMLTGEPTPVSKTAGAEVFAGTLNSNGTLIVQATGVGEQTVLAGIVKLVQDAQSVKLPIQQLVDRVTLWFVPTVLGLAAAAFALWWFLPAEPELSKSILTAVTVLIIACPCAMGLATPLSIMVATGTGARNGVWFRRGDALQTLSEAKIVAVDKTGTLTEGHPAVVDCWTVHPELTTAELLRKAAWLEQSSEHPLAGAIVRAAKDRQLDPGIAPQALTIPGRGIAMQVDEAGADMLRVGSIPWLSEFAGPLPVSAEAKVPEWEAGAATVVGVVEGERWLGVLAIADRLRDSAVGAVRALQGSGRRVIMITGDRIGTANAVAAKLGLDGVHAEAMPSGKADLVDSLKRQGKVVFVGDGMNDAPALAVADVGIAIGSGTDVAVHAAEVVLMGHDLNKAAFAIALSGKTLRNIRQNLFWAFAYNITLLPVAAGALYPMTGLLLSPMLAAGAMTASSICVVLNALRLRRL